MAFVALAISVSDVVDSLVGHQVGIVEEHTVEADTHSEFEAFAWVEFVADKEAWLVETYTSSRISFTTVTVGQTYDFRSSTIDEVVNAVVAVVTCTVTHI